MKAKTTKPLSSLFGSPPPPKEGRYHSHQYTEKRKSLLFKLLAGALALALTYIIFISTTDTQTPSRHTERARELLEQSSGKAVVRPPKSVPVATSGPGPAGNVKTVEHEEVEEEHILVQKPKKQKPQQKPPPPPPKAPSQSSREDDDGGDDDDSSDGPRAGGKASYGKNKPTKDEAKPIRTKPKITTNKLHFKKDLDRIFELLPDEMHVRELLRPIEGTGKEKLRETGLRARAFKTFFEAWEKVHLVQADDEVYVRDDIVQELRHDTSIDNIAQTIHQYEAYRGFLQRLATLLFPYISPYFADHMSLHAQMYKGGRGIVLSAGDEQAPFLLTSIPSFRKLGCDLPIEVMYLGDSDLSEDYRAELEQLPGVVTRDISTMVRDEGWRLAGWAAKPFAMLLSSFREVIFIDADSLFFKNPEILFEDAEYKRTGALFFRDRIIMPEMKKRWLQQILPKPISKNVRQTRFWSGESGHQQESGVVVVDKWRHFVSMLMVTRMNGPDRDGNEAAGLVGVYDMVYGDKETFWLGWELVGDTDYVFHQGDAGIMGELKESPTPTDTAAVPTGDVEPTQEKFTVCAPQLLHLDLEGRPLWFNGWILSNKFADKRSKKVNNFKTYLREIHKVQDSDEQDPWQLTENNICCLTTHEQYFFTKEEDQALKMITELAQKVGAYGKKGK